MESDTVVVTASMFCGAVVGIGPYFCKIFLAHYIDIPIIGGDLQRHFYCCSHSIHLNSLSDAFLMPIVKSKNKHQRG